MAYNPYDAINKIYAYKQAYDAARNSGQNTTDAENGAKQYYKELRDNGYLEYADEMSKATTEQAKTIVDKLKTVPTTPVSATSAAPTFQNAAPAKADNSIYQSITPDVLNWATGIYDNKTLYDNAKYTAGDNDYTQYENAAKPLYESLKNAGRSDIADYLSGSDVPTAQAYLKSIGIDLNGEDLNGAFTALLNGGSKTQDIGTILSESQPILDYISQKSQPDAATTAANQAAQANLQTLFNNILGNNSSYNAQSQQLYDQMAKYTGDQSARYDDLYGWLKNNDYYSGDTAKNIMSYYNTQGNKAANGASADAAANNGGNLDSYAAANALRQQLDFTNAGNNAVLNQYNATAGNMLSSLQALGVDVGDAQNRMVDLVQGNQTYNNKLLDSYNTGNSDVLNYINGQSANASGNTLDALGKMLEYYTNQNNTQSSDYQSQLSTIAQLLGNRDTLKSTENQLSASNAFALAQLNTQLDASKQISDAELKNALDVAGIEANITAAQLANAYKIAAENNTSSERISANQLAAAIQQAAIGADADKYSADKNLESDKYAADKSVEEAGAKADGKSKTDGSDYDYTDVISAVDNFVLAYRSKFPDYSDDELAEMAWATMKAQKIMSDDEIAAAKAAYANSKLLSGTGTNGLIN